MAILGLFRFQCFDINIFLSIIALNGRPLG